MVGTPCCAASMTASPQPSLRDGSTCTQACCSTWCLVAVVDVPVEGHRVGDAQPRGVVDQPLLPPAAADDVEMQVGYPGPQLGDRVQRVLDLLVRHQPRQHQPPAASPTAAPLRVRTAPRRARCAPRRFARGRTPRSTRSRADGSDTVTYWLRRCTRGDSLDSTNQPILPSTGPPPATVRDGSGAPAPPPAGRRAAGPGTAGRSGCR